jgi:glutaminyl-peptide cyclotransferase
MRFSRPLTLAMLTSVALAASSAQSSHDSGFDADRAWSHLEALVGLGARPSGSKANESARSYIERSLKEAGLDPIRETFSAPTPSGHVTFTNVYADFPATTTNETDPAPIVVLCTHFDTKRLEIDFVGANDGGSGTAVLLELARSLAGRPRAIEPDTRPPTYRFLFLDGEEALRSYWAGEDHTYGSRHHVSELRKSRTLDRVAACVLLDMVGDADLKLTREKFSERELVDLFFDAATSIGLGAHVEATPRSIKDDHQRFIEAGVPSVNLIDFEYGAFNEHWHEATDTLANCSQKSLDAIGRIVLAGLPKLEAWVAKR